MIVIDTNVLSELMKAVPNPKVKGWAKAQRLGNLFTTTITQAEILYGIDLLPTGRRREALQVAAVGLFEEDFSGRLLSFDSEAARAFAEIALRRRQVGRPISQFDAQIAAIARSRGACLATRNVTDFEGCGIELVNPWED